MAILGDDHTADLRREIFRVGSFQFIEAFPQKDDPERRVFREAKLSTAAFGILKSPSDQSFTSRTNPANTFDREAPTVLLCASEIPLYDPNNVTIVSCSQPDWSAATRITVSGRLRRLRDSIGASQGEVNETVARANGDLATSSNGKLVLRGANVCLYVTRPASQGEEIWLNTRRFLEGKPEGSKAFHHRYQRVGWQESCPQNNFRRIIASLIPVGEFCNHKINYIPTPSSSFPLQFLLAFLNSKLADWYFRLGSTNAAVSHYQIGNLPCPIFAQSKSDADRKLSAAANVALDAQDFEKLAALLGPACKEPPFSLAIQDVIIATVERIIAIERARGEIARSERSHLDPKAQPYQDLIDHLFFRMAGLSKEESAALEERLSRML